MNPTVLFENAFAKSPQAQLIVTAGKVFAANRAAGNLLLGNPDISSLVDSPVETYFLESEKALSIDSGSCLLPLCSSAEMTPVACNVVVTRLSAISSLWALEPMWEDQLRPNCGESTLLNALDTTSEAVICIGGSRASRTQRSHVVKYLNKGAEAYFDLQGGPVVGRRLRNVFRLHDALKIEARLEEAVSGKRISFQANVLSPEGSETCLAVTINAQSEEEIVISLRDVTEERRVQNRLEKSSNDLDRLSEQIPGVYFHLKIDDNGEPRFPYISEKVKALLGVEASEVMANASIAMGCVCIEDLERVYESIAISCQNLTPLYIEYRVVVPSGRKKWVSIKAIPEKRVDEEVVLYGIFEDVTLRKESEERLRMVSAAVEASSDFVLMVNNQGRALYRNNSFANIVGYETIDQLNDAGGAKTLFSEKHVFDKIFQETLEYGHWQGDVQVMTESNRMLDIYFRSVSVMDEKGRVTALVITGTDVTHNKRRQNLLKRYNSVLKAQSEAATDGILVVNERGIVSNFNKRFCGIWELPTSLMDVGKPEKIWRVASAQMKDSEAFFKRSMEISINDSETFKDTLEFADGRIFERTSIPISSPMGESYGRVWFFHEVTEQKRSEERLLATMREAEEANKAKSYFLANMSHEIRTPMNGIIGMTGLLMETELEREQQDYVDTIRASSEALLVVINDILDFSKIESGKLEIENIMFDLRDCLEEAIDTLAIQAAEKGLDISYVFGKEIPQSLLGDPTRLRQIIVNLVGNAVKFTAKGGVVVKVDPFHIKDDDVILHFQIKDTGIGIPADRIDRLFGSFSQVDASTTRKYGGTGLGLAISKNLAELMGGSMWVESVEGKGSTFHFTVSFNRAAFAFDLTSSSVANQFEGKKALVVDSHDFSREGLVSQLKALKVETIEGRHFDEIASCFLDEPDLNMVFVDYGIDGISPDQIKKSVREAAGDELFPVLFTGRLGGVQLGEVADEKTLTLIKPYKLENLRNRLLEATGRTVQRVRRVTSDSSQMGDQMPLRILLAEDNAVNQKVAMRLFKKMGYEIAMASNGLEAVNMIADNEYDLVFMDIQMPEMDGLEATEEIIKRWGDNRPRIIALTANAMREDREKCYGIGMDGYLTKPFKRDDLKDTITKTYVRLQEEKADKSPSSEA
ncbi:ATP-binding protein [Pelagicoccus sp. SDUM812003]|uniref:ATP-binding protein n=1 Tax=Pelagicoccus sp. SDUM812003 TaxID=3041267 RepID=UPI00280F379F|nr:ATP-binding protein [Pelagicoccus sp. SDUM812003]MDQ8203437.1 ATP-binding protein [Pelagicoccus sp. SDUM812003]